MTSTYTNLNPLAIRKRLGKEDWAAPVPFGGDGWRFDTKADRGRIIVTCSEFTSIGEPSGQLFVHASWSWSDRLPSYDELTLLHKAVWPEGYAYQVFAPPSDHVNIHPYALHLWGRLDGDRMLPHFGKFGSI